MLEKRWEMISDGLYADSLVKMAELKKKDAVQLHQEDANMKGKITPVFQRLCSYNWLTNF